MIALVIGATGATGKDLVEQLLNDDSFKEVHIFIRRNSGVNHSKLHEHLVDFEQINTWKDKLKGDILFSVLGTTIKQAGSQEIQWKVDHTYQYEVAKSACENGVNTLVLISSAWANAKSKVFYTRMKGQLEDEIIKLGFTKTIIIRPPSLIRKNSDRFGEKASVAILKVINKIGLLRSMQPISTEQVACTMIKTSKENTKGVRILEAKEIKAIK